MEADSREVGIGDAPDLASFKEVYFDAARST
jgi:hypothetical protein